MIDDPLDIFLADFAEDEDLVFAWSGGTKNCRGIFDNGFVDAQIGEISLTTTQPRLTCKASDVVGVVPREATVTLRGENYSVTDIQPDGTGFAVVTLAHEPA